MAANAKSKKTSPDEQQPDVIALQAQVAELTDALQRERADAMNVRRRAEEERAKLAGYHKAAVVRALLPVIDNFDRALKHIPTELQGNEYMKGVEAVVKQFEKTLAELGVTRIKTVGEVFDPTLHEAVSMDEGEGGTTEIVSEELQSGFMLQDEVIRHAMVRVRLQ